MGQEPGCSGSNHRQAMAAAPTLTLSGTEATADRTAPPHRPRLPQPDFRRLRLTIKPFWCNDTLCHQPGLSRPPRSIIGHRRCKGEK